MPKGQALTGVILSSVAMIVAIVAIVMTIIYSLMFASVLGESFEESFETDWEITEEDPFGGESLFDKETGFEEESDFEEVEWEPVPEGELGPELGIPDGAGTADSPLPLGTPMRVRGMKDWEYELVLGPPLINANDYVAQADPANKPPAAGAQYVAVDATVTYIGSEEERERSPSFGLSFVSSDGRVSEYNDTPAEECAREFHGSQPGAERLSNHHLPQPRHGG